MARVTIENLSIRDQAFRAEGGLVVVPRGESMDLDLTSAISKQQINALQMIGCTVVPAEDDGSIDELREKASFLGVEWTTRWGKKRLETEIAKAEKAAIEPASAPVAEPDPPVPEQPEDLEF